MICFAQWDTSKHEAKYTLKVLAHVDIPSPAALQNPKLSACEQDQANLLNGEKYNTQGLPLPQPIASTNQTAR